MSFTKFAASLAIILGLGGTAAAAIVDAAIEAPFGSGLGWQAYRTPEASRYPQRALAPRLSGLSKPFWSGEQQQEETAPLK